MRLAHVAGLWRYPVKGLRGESVTELNADAHGIAGDRRYAFVSSGAPTGKPLLTGRERAAMLLYRASTVDGQIFVETPHGSRFAVDDPACAMSIQASLPQGNRIALQRGDRPFTDCRPIALLSSQTLTALSTEYGSMVDPRRFRANLILQFDLGTGNGPAFSEDDLVGRRIRIGQTVELRITERDPRCRIVTLDPETAEQDPALMKHLDRHHEGRLGVYAATMVPGTMRVGDPVQLVPMMKEGEMTLGGNS